MRFCSRCDCFDVRQGGYIDQARWFSLIGTWLGYQNDTVQFQIDGQPVVYPRSDVASVVFGVGPPTLSSPVSTAKPVAAKLPEFIGAVYFQDPAGALIPLEKEKPKAKVNLLRSRYNYQMAGAKSSVRVKSAATLLFVVRLANGVDPSSMTLHVLSSVKDARQVATDPDQKNAAYLTIPVNVTKVGDSTYGLSPARELKPGEFAFSPQGVNTGYSFGVDAAEQK